MARSKIFALVLIFAAIGVAAGTGAFTTAEADRTAEVNVAGDANALVGIEPVENGTTELVTEDGSSGQVVMNLDSASSNAAGVNANAATDFGNVLNISNNGEETVEIKIEVATEAVSPGSVHFYVGNDSETDNGAQLSTVGNSDFQSNAANTSVDEDPGDGRFNADQKYSITSDREASGGNTTHIAVSLDSGDTVTVGFAIDLFGQDLTASEEVISDITIVADADLSGEAEGIVNDESLSDDPEDV